MTPAVARVEPEQEATASRAARWRRVLELTPSALVFKNSSTFVLLGIAVFLWLEVFVVALVPVFISNDQVINLDNAARMLRGQVIYRNFFQYTLPGTELFYVVCFLIFGVRQWIPNAALIIVGTATAWLGIVIARRLLSGWYAFVPVLLFIYAYHFILDGTHHKFSVLFAIAACAILMERQDLKRIFFAGGLLGVSACFTQTRGALVLIGLAVFITLQGWIQRQRLQHLLVKITAVFTGFTLVVLPVSAWYAEQAGVVRFINQIMVFPLKYYRADAIYNTWSVIAFPHAKFTDARSLAYLAYEVVIYGLIPGVYLGTAVYLWLKRSQYDGQTLDRLAILTVFGLALYASVAYAPSFVRLCEIALPAFILACWFLQTSVGSTDLIFGVITSVAILVFIGSAVHTQTRWHEILKTATGPAAFLERGEYRRVEAVASRTAPGEFFFEAPYCDVYVALALRNPAPVPYVTANDYTRPEQVDATVRALERSRVRLILWSTSLDGGGPADHLAPLRAYLRRYYHTIERLGDGWTLLERSQ